MLFVSVAVIVIPLPTLVRVATTKIVPALPLNVVVRRPASRRSLLEKLTVPV